MLIFAHIIYILNDYRGEVNLDAEEIKASKVIQEDAEMVEVRRVCVSDSVLYSSVNQYLSVCDFCSIYIISYPPRCTMDVSAVL